MKESSTPMAPFELVATAFLMTQLIFLSLAAEANGMPPPPLLEDPKDLMESTRLWQSEHSSQDLRPELDWNQIEEADPVQVSQFPITTQDKAPLDLMFSHSKRSASLFFGKLSSIFDKDTPSEPTNGPEIEFPAKLEDMMVTERPIPSPQPRIRGGRGARHGKDRKKYLKCYFNIITCF